MFIGMFKVPFSKRYKRISFPAKICKLTKTIIIIYHATRTPATNLRVRLGDFNLKGQTELYPHEEFTVKRKVVNEFYNPATYQNDIALLELSEEVVYRQHIIPVCLPAKGDNFTGKTATVTGWGRTQVSGYRNLAHGPSIVDV